MNRKYFDEVSPWMLDQGIRDYTCGCKVVEIHERLSVVKTRVLVESCNEHNQGLINEWNKATLI